MDVGLSLVWQNPDHARPDRDVYRDELALADQAEDLGFDSIWTVEHHFSNYSTCPDTLQFLTYMAGRTTTAKLGTMVVVLPWHDPVRVAEQITMLDTISGGRAVIGIGRGSARSEFEGFRIPMDESLPRFVEGAEILMAALETGTVKYDGEYFQIPERDIRPEPMRSFKGRLFAAAVSPASVQSIAKLGLQILIIPQKPYEMAKADVETYSATFRELNGNDPGPTATALYIFCDEDERRARELGEQYVGNYYRSSLTHYELTGDHFAKTKGYETYAGVAGAIKKHGVAGITKSFVDLHGVGTPEQVFNKIKWVREYLNSETVMAQFMFGGMEYAEAERNLHLFAREVLPEVKKLPPITATS